jgi:hypothetical protein
MGLKNTIRKIKFAYKCYKDFDQIKSVVKTATWECESPSQLEYAFSSVVVTYFNKDCYECTGSPKVFGRSPF